METISSPVEFHRCTCNGYCGMHIIASLFSFGEIEIGLSPDFFMDVGEALKSNLTKLLRSIWVMGQTAGDGCELAVVPLDSSVKIIGEQIWYVSNANCPTTLSYPLNLIFVESV